MFKYKPLKMDAESAQNVGFKNRKIQLLECKIFKYKPLKMDAEKSHKL